jgi:hypothetical protein
VADLRVVLDREQGQPTLRWATTHERLRPGRDDGFAYPVPFSVLGRSTREVIAEFEPSGDFDWSPSSDVAQPLRLQGRIHPSDDWVISSPSTGGRPLRRSATTTSRIATSPVPSAT